MNGEDPDKQRDRIVSKIYDAVLHPEEANSFIREWEQFITQASASFVDRRNAQGPSEMVLRDTHLEGHFARAHALLEKFGRREAGRAGNIASDDTGLLCVFDLNGSILEETEAGAATFGPLGNASDLLPFLDPTGADDWKTFLQNVSRAPLLDQFRVFARAESGNIVVLLRRDEATGKARILVKSLETAWTPPLRAVLAADFGLTNGELTLAEQLTRLGSLDRIAKLSTRSQNTLRTQLKSVFRKLNVHSQPEVLQSIAMLSHFCAVVGYDALEQKTLPHLGRSERIDLGDLGTTSVHFIGPENGRPVLFIHGMMDGVAATKEMLKALQRHHIRLIAPVRANFGDASPTDSTENMPALFARQMVRLTESLALQDFVMLGHMSGAPFAFAAAQKMVGRCRGVVNVAGGVPILSLQQFATMAPRQKAFAYTTRFAPVLLPTLLRVGVAQLDSMGITGVINDMYADNSRDKTVLQDRDIAAVVIDGYRFAVAQGYRGFEGDALQVTRDWGEYLAGITVPVRLLHGAHDQVVSLSSVAEFASRHGFDLRRFGSEGQLLLYAAPDQVFQNVAEMFDSAAI